MFWQSQQAHIIHLRLHYHKECKLCTASAIISSQFLEVRSITTSGHPLNSCTSIMDTPATSYTHRAELILTLEVKSIKKRGGYPLNHCTSIMDQPATSYTHKAELIFILKVKSLKNVEATLLSPAHIIMNPSATINTHKAELIFTLKSQIPLE